MKKHLMFLAAAAGLIATSCSQDEPKAVLPAARNQISYTVTADDGSRSSSAYTNGTDVNSMHVSAWAHMPADLPGYGSSNGSNSAYFLNDLLTRQSGEGTFNYAQDARFWPINGEELDFWAVVDNDKLLSKDENGNLVVNPDDHKFGFDAQGGHPGLEGTIYQGGVDNMPDLLYAHTFGMTSANGNPGTDAFQKNVSFSFHHAFAKVVVTAEVRNSNLRVCITDMEIHGIAPEGQFGFPYLSGQGLDHVDNPAHWTVDGEKYANITGLLAESLPYTEIAGHKALVLDKAEKDNIKKKHNLIGPDAPGDLLVIPRDYNGRNASSNQTYILLRGFAYNISNKENGWDEDSDILIYPKRDANNKLVPAEMIIPIEFHWAMGTVNHYNIVFDCGNGGSTSENPNDPAFIRIGYECEVLDWTTGEQKNEHEENGQPVDNSVQYPIKK